MITRRPARRSSNVGTAFVLSLLVMPVLMVIYGSTLAKLWEWFIADTFGVMTLSAAQAIGVSMTVTFVTYQEDAANPSDDAIEGFVRHVLVALIRAGLALLIGAIVKGFVGA